MTPSAHGAPSPMTTDATTYRQRQILLFLFGVVLFHEPFLSLLRVESSLASIPILPVALFGIWVALIGGAWWMARGDRFASKEAVPWSAESVDPPGDPSTGSAIDIQDPSRRVDP